MTTPHYKPSAIALTAPPMSPKEYRDLVYDIQAHGLRVPIVLFDGQILDGVHRERCCKELKIPPRYVQWKARHPGDTPIAFAASQHTRRNLTDQQRAVYAARLANLKRGRPGTNPPIGGISQAQATGYAGASLRSVQRASYVVHAGIAPLTDLVAGDKLPLDVAVKFAKLPENKTLHTTKADKANIAAQGPKAVRDHLASLKHNAFDQLHHASVGQTSLLPPPTPEEQARQEAVIEALFHDSPVEAAAVRLASRNDHNMAMVLAHASQVRDFQNRLPRLSHDHARLLAAAWFDAYKAAKKKMGNILGGRKVLRLTSAAKTTA